MKKRMFIKKWVLLLLGLSLCTSCSMFKEFSESTNEDLTIGAAVGAVAGAGIGYAIGGESGAVIGAGIGVAAGAAIVIVIDKVNRKQIQEALKVDQASVFQDEKTGQKIKIVPAMKYVNKDKLSCIDFGVHNLDLKTYKLGNSACKINGEFEFIVAVNNMLTEPIINHVTPWPIPDPAPKPQAY